MSIFYNESLLILDVVGKIIDGFFMVDFVFNFFTAYYDKDTLITSKCSIAKRYIKGAMILDLITAIPLNILLPTGIKDSTYPIESIKVKAAQYPRLLQFIRLSK